MTYGKRALVQLVVISLMIGFMVVGYEQGTQTASNTGEDEDHYFMRIKKH